MFDFYEVVTHDLLSHDLREQLDTWNILARARNEGRLFSRIAWPRDPEIVSPSGRRRRKFIPDTGFVVLCK
jgi:callose synthase